MNNIIFSSFDSWKTADFTTLLKDLDTIASEIANEKDQSDTSRKILIEKNKKFKEQVSLESRKEVAPLLKCFQNEVDCLNKRNKSLETNLLMFYKRLIDLPDPCPALELSIASQKKLQKLQDITLENRKLREALEDYQKEFSDVKNQEFTIKQLKDRIKEIESGIENSIEAQCKEREREMINMFAEKERELDNERSDIEQKLKDMETKVDTAERALQESQGELFQMKIKVDEYSSAKSYEIDLLLGENERTVERVKYLENQLSNLTTGTDRRTILGNNPQSGNEDAKTLAELNELKMELSAKENEVQKLSEEVRKAHMLFNQNERKMQDQINDLENDLSLNVESMDKLKKELLSQSDYEELKREMNIIKSIEFSDLNREESSFVGENNISTKPLEQLLLEKNRHLQTEFLQIKSTHSQMQVDFDKLRDDYSDSKQIIIDQKHLINQLEDHLHKIKTFSSTFRGSGEGSDETMSPISLSEVNSPSGRMNEASILANVLENLSDIDANSGSNSLLSIVQSQRDRFKIRTQELEETSQSYQKEIQFLQTEVEHIRTDNVKLYEKVKFLQSYSRNSQPYSDDGIMSKYSDQYEAKLNPFERFNHGERQRQYQSLPPHEKIMLSMGRFVMGNRTARLFAFLYSLLLHFLIFVVLYKLAYTEACVRDQALECRKEFASHMKKVHGGSH